MRLLTLFAALLAVGAAPLAAQPAPPPEPASVAVEQLRHAIGLWNVETDFVAADGSVARTLIGQYRFGWVVPDRVVSGMSTIPELNQASAILFFVRPGRSEIEMASVGADGHLWRMIGPDDGETRTTPNTVMVDGSTLMLRFTRYDVTPDSFRSRMERSTDGGQTWSLGNRQRFVRAEGE
ncbi:hypothetical protein [Parasphingopyxis lamellibrachiae]|uniref:DUF1579 domain-containing protein n=1 Tax=Parasphingopyxis lamellibrachiae TaxID=680125 RepID=A0A3D9FGZ0_9SPHN|nr:hypothetical protein [Parasphingopyxis lamellibrachiae]RED16918.1 hypothetical protein DFR46_1952 [Parasphingopyxis lamellibrachiae]